MKEKTITISRSELETCITAIDNDSFNIAGSLLRKLLNPMPIMTEEDWQRIISETFYVFTDGDVRYPFSLSNKTINAKQLMDKSPEILRIKGHRQPHFKGHQHPLGNETLCVTFIDGSTESFRANEISEFEWDSVVEYIII